MADWGSEDPANRKYTGFSWAHLYCTYPIKLNKFQMIKPFRRRLAYVMAAVEHQLERQNTPPPGTGAMVIEPTVERDPQTQLIRPAANRNVQTPRAVAPVYPGSHAEDGGEKFPAVIR